MSTCEIACFGGRELSLKGWQDVRPTTLDQAYNIEPISQVDFVWLLRLDWGNPGEGESPTHRHDVRTKEANHYSYGRLPTRYSVGSVSLRRRA